QLLVAGTGFMPSHRTFRLDSDTETVLLRSSDAGVPELVYWGLSLARAYEAGEWAARGVPHGMLDGGERLSLLPEAGRGFTGQSGLLAHRAGRDFVTQFVQAGATQAGNSLRLEFRDDIAHIGLVLEIAVDAATGVLSFSSTLENLGADGLEVQWL